ncbi:MAG TPA: alpha/beta hydrolase [Deferrisomatales bacterium]|nr:alpha/beta hydrolase [Deferrisomatales bacterium]
MRLLQIPLALAGVYLALVTLTWLFQRRLIYLPLGGTVPAVGAVLPGAEAVELDTADGLRVGAWYVPAAGGAPQATVIFCNGNAGNRADRAPLAAALSGHGLAVLLFDYRGYGGNPGTPSEAGLYADLRAARRYAAETLGVPPGRQVLFGESLGAAVALAGAVEEPPAGLVLRSPFTSLVAVGRVHYPFLPVAALLRDRYPSLVRVPRLRCPLLVLAGGRDQIVPTAQSRELYAAATVTDRRWVSYPEADHNSRRFLDDPEMVGEVAKFVLRVVHDR